jgi:predicted helicase
MKCNISDRSPVPQTVDHHDSQVFAASSRVQVQVIVMKKSDAISKQMIFFLI